MRPIDELLTDDEAIDIIRSWKGNIELEWSNLDYNEEIVVDYISARLAKLKELEDKSVKG